MCRVFEVAPPSRQRRVLSAHVREEKFQTNQKLHRYSRLITVRKLILVNLWINLNRIVKVCNNMLFPCVVSDFFLNSGFFFLWQNRASNHFWLDNLEWRWSFFVFSLELSWSWIKKKQQQIFLVGVGLEHNWEPRARGTFSSLPLRLSPLFAVSETRTRSSLLAR